MADFLDHCYKGDLNDVIAAVGRGVDVNSEDSYGHSGLMMAVGNSHNQVVEWLLQQRGIDASRGNRGGWTALHMAVNGNNPSGLSLLLVHPTADPTARNDRGMTPLEECR